MPEDTELQPAREKSLYVLGAACRESFVRLLQKGNDQADSHLQQRMLELFHQRDPYDVLGFSDLGTECERFQSWAHEVGVFVPGQDSLDSNMRETKEVRDSLITFLKTLNADLVECHYVLQQNRTFNANDEEQDSDTDDDSCLSDGFDLAQETDIAAYELQSRFRNISDVVGKLLKLTAIMRSSSFHAQAFPAATYEHVEDDINHTTAFEKDCLPIVLKRRYNVDEPLLTRLCKALALRRRRFLYHAKHQKRLVYGREGWEGTSKKPDYETQMDPDAALGVIHAPLAESTALDKEKDDQREVDASNEESSLHHESKPIEGTIAGGGTEVSRAEIPAPAALPYRRASYFECPYCCVLLPISQREGKAWEQHFIADLQPFVCVESECAYPDIHFKSKDDWIEHQRWEHAMKGGAKATVRPMRH